MNVFVVIYLILLDIDLIENEIIESSTAISPIKDCGQLCDSPKLDAITPLSVDSDSQFLVLIIRDSVCAFVLDLNNPIANHEYGRRHYFKYPRLQSLFTIFDDPTSSKRFNLMILFSSGMVGEVWRGVDGVVDRLSDGALPLKGLGHNMLKVIDGSFSLQSDPEKPLVRIIQTNYSMTYDLKDRKRVSGPDPLLKDYSYDFKKFGQIKGAFRRKNDIYFLADKYYYVWKSEDGKTGVLEKGKSITKELYKCKDKFETSSTIAWPFLVPITTLGTPIPLITEEGEIDENSDDITGTSPEENDVSRETNETIDDITTPKEVSDDYYDSTSATNWIKSRETTADGEDNGISEQTQMSFNDRTTSRTDMTIGDEDISETIGESVTEDISDESDDDENRPKAEAISGEKEDKNKTKNNTSSALLPSFLILITVIPLSISALIDCN